MIVQLVPVTAVAEDVAAPVCDQGCNAETVGAHQDSCAVKVYYRDLFTGSTADTIYAMKGQLPADAWEYILNVGWQLDNPKRMELDTLLKEGETPADPAPTEPTPDAPVAPPVLTAPAPEEETGTEGIPACSGAPTCWGETNGEPMNNHVDTCARKAYLITFVQGNDAKSIAALWDGFTEKEQADIMSMVEAYNPGIAEELKALVGGSGEEPDFEETTVSGSVGGKPIAASGSMSADAKLTLATGSAAKGEYFSDNLMDLSDSDTVNSYVFDISLSGSFEGSVTLSVGGIPVAGDHEEIVVVHLLDSAEAIAAAKARGTVQSYTASGLSASFPEETAAAGSADTIYYEGLPASRDANGNVVFTTTSFSSFIIYTVDFHYNGITFSIPGGTGILLSELFEQLEIDKDVADVKNVSFTNAELVSITQENGDWRLTSLKAFSTIEELKITLTNGETIKIVVTDAAHNTANDAIQLEEAGFIDTSVPYRIFSAVPGVDATWSVWSGGKRFIRVYLYDADGSLVDYADFNNMPDGFPWLGFRGSYWYELTDTDIIGMGSYADGKNTIKLGGSSWLWGDHKAYVTRYPLTIFNNTNNSYCEVTQVAEFVKSGDKESRTVNIYVDGVKKETKSVVFPNRGDSGDALVGDIVVSAFSGYARRGDVGRGDTVTVSGDTYNVWLVTRHTVNAQVSGSGSASPASQTVLTGDTASITFTANTGYQIDYLVDNGTKKDITNVGTYQYSISNVQAAHTVTAYTTPINYTITYNTVGGSAVPTQNYNIGTNVTLAAASTKPGYSFTKWNLGTAAGNWTAGNYNANQNIGTGKYGNIALTAQWDEISYTVSFNGNGATGGSMNNQSFKYDEAKALTANGFERKYTVTFNGNGGTAATASAVADATFNGWEDRGAISYNGTSYSYNSSVPFDAPYYVSQNSSATSSLGYNKYNLINHYITTGKNQGLSAKGSTPGLYPNGATVANLTTTNGYTVPLYANWTLGKVTLPNATRDGYRFLGWYTAAEGGTFVGNASAEYEPKANTPLYAHWEQNSHTVTASVSSNGTASPATQSVKHGESGTVTFTANTGYKIAYIMDGTTKVDITDAASYTYTVSNVTADRTVVAHTVADTYPVTYNANGGTGAPAAQTKTHNVTLTLSSDEPIRDGYEFNSWNTKSDGTGTTYAPSGSYTGNAPLNLYAKWDPEQYTITYDSDGGSAVDPQTYDIEDDVTLAADSTKEGYDFIGWRLSSAVNTWQAKTYGAEENVGTGKYGDITLVAQWEAIDYTVTFHHYLEGTTTKLHEDTTADIAFGTKVSVANYAQQIANHAVASCDPAQLEVKVSGNEAIIYYKPLTASYTIKVYKQQVTGNGYDMTSKTEVGNIGATVSANPTDYVETGFTFVVGKSTASGEITADGGLVLELYFDRVLYKVTYEYTGTVPPGAPEVPAQKEYRYGAKATAENAPTLTGYEFSGWNQTGEFLVYDHMTVTGSWTANTDAWYLVHYYLENTTESLQADKREEGKTYGESYTETAPAIPGYTPVKESQSVTAGYENNVITFFYRPNTDTKYKVEHYLRHYSNNTPELKDTDNLTGTTGAETQAEAKDYPGYTAAAFEQLEIAGDGSTVVKIYYDEQPVTVNYHSENEAYGTVNPAAEGPVGAATGEISGSVPTAKDGFKFVGWYEDSACTKPVASGLVNADTNKLTPAKVDGLNVAADYYAKFAPIESQIKIVMHVDGKYANLKLPFTGTLNWDHYEGSPQTTDSASYSLKNGETKDGITVQAGSTFYLTDMMLPENYAFVKAEYKDVKDTDMQNGAVENDGFVLTEGESELHIYYKAIDVTETGLYLGNAGAIAAILAVCAALIVIYVIGRRRRRNED